MRTLGHEYENGTAQLDVFREKRILLNMKITTKQQCYL